MKEQVYGAEKGHGEEVVSWIKTEVESTGMKLKIRLEDYIIHTQNFGDFELISLSSDSLTATPYVTPIYWATACSNASTLGPVVNQSDRNT